MRKSGMAAPFQIVYAATFGLLNAPNQFIFPMFPIVSSKWPSAT
jgi:hypothetical protein